MATKEQQDNIKMLRDNLWMHQQELFKAKEQYDFAKMMLENMEIATKGSEQRLARAIEEAGKALPPSNQGKKPS